ncbi:MAG: hypothetical protein ACREIF_17655 [Chthoniobacterales bacterium]
MDASLGEADPLVIPLRRGETAAHLELKRLALRWAQENRYPIAALEVSLPQCRYRADVAAYRPQKNGTLGHTAVFECKQSTPDLRRDDCRSPQAFARLEAVYHRRQILEKHLRIHYPTLRTGETLFPEWDAHDFGAIQHRGYERVTRELVALQAQLRDGRKFERLARYACANLFYLVVPNDFLREPEAPLGWGLLAEKEGVLTLRRKPAWHDATETARLRVLQKIAAAGTRQLNRQLEIAPPPFAGIRQGVSVRKTRSVCPQIGGRSDQVKR